MGTVKAICLFSGGLDSILAAKVLEAQGIEVLAVKFISPFFGNEVLTDLSPLIREVAEKWQIVLSVVDITEDYLPMLKSPAHGYGKNLNPCIDCKILMLKKARELMEASGARFIATGEVIGQRPMSQRRDTMRIVERDSGLEGLLLRPLSAKLLRETLPEREGWVDRDRLFDFSGRSRARQMALARELNITNYPSPAGGCILTDSVLSKRIEYVLKKQNKTEADDIFLCRVGRHFVWTEGGHLVVARNQAENKLLEPLARRGRYLLKVKAFPGPLGLLMGEEISSARLLNAAEIVCRYSKARHETAVEVWVKEVNAEKEFVLSVSPCWELEDMECSRI